MPVLPTSSLHPRHSHHPFKNQTVSLSLLSCTSHFFFFHFNFYLQNGGKETLGRTELLLQACFEITTEVLQSYLRVASVNLDKIRLSLERQTHVKQLMLPFGFITSLRLQFLDDLLFCGLVWRSFSMIGKVGANRMLTVCVLSYYHLLIL